MLLMLVALAHALPTQNASYTADTTPWGAVDLTAVGTPFASYGDDNEVAITLPFTFPYYDASYTSATVSYNGAVRFHTTEVDYVNTSYAAAGTQPDISCWWDDLLPTRAITTWSDTANNRLIISWDDTKRLGQSGNDTVDFQMMLYADGTIECHYTDTSFADARYDRALSATIGFADVVGGLTDNDAFLELSYNTTPTWLADQTAVRFAPCEDADGDGFACYDCDDTEFDTADSDGDHHPDSCDVCPDASTLTTFGATAPEGDCSPGVGEITLFVGAGWTSTCRTFGPGKWNLTALVAAGIPNDTASSVLVGPFAHVTLYQHAGYGGTSLTLTDDDDDIFALGLSSISVWYDADLATTGDGCPSAQAGCTDGDGDGFCAETWDCDDTDAATSPLGVDVCGEVDHDCDGVAPVDLDDDGACDDDCDDLDPTISPYAAEQCDGVDHDCDGVTWPDSDVDADLVCEPGDTSWDGWTSRTLEGGTDDGTSLVLTDANLDGDLDVFATYNTRRVMGFISNLGSGTFGSSQNRSVSSAKLFDLDAGDIDGDGDPDAIVSGESPTLLSWARNNGTSFAAATMTVATVTERPRAVKLADLDGDGDQDAIAAFYSAGAVRTWLNNGAGSFTAQSTLSLVGADRLAVADVDADGHLDLAALSSGGASVVWLNRGGGAWTQVALTGTVGNYELVAADLDSDGFADLAACGLSGVMTWRSVGDGSFGAGAQVSTRSTVDLRPADLDADGDVDLAASWSSTTQIGALLNDGAGAFPIELVLTQLGADTAQDIDAGDLDGDGDVDLAIQVPGATDRLYALTNPLYVDEDHDGFRSALDCDDSEPDVYPGAAEACDGEDDDCDGVIDDGAADADADGTCDALDACPADAAGDSDGDGSCDSADLCTGDDATGDADADGTCADLDLCLGDDATGDTDADGTCDGSDVCPLDAADDSDGDGSCDSADLCTGDDTAGDSDGDGECDDTDFILSATTVRAGTSLTLSALHASPGARVYFLLGTSGTGSGPCYPGTAICTDLRSPTVLGSATADAAGRARLTVTVPATVPAGRTVRFQSGWFRTAGGVTSGELSNVVVAVSQ